MYRTCPDCGANLDPSERCDCQDQQEQEDEENKKATMPASTVADPQKGDIQ